MELKGTMKMQRVEMSNVEAAAPTDNKVGDKVVVHSVADVTQL